MTDTLYTPRHLKLWTMPEYYSGEVWPAYYSAGFGQSRDSDCLEASNFAAAVKALKGHEYTIVREGHWAVGWVEWIAIHQDEVEALKIADALIERVQNYPVLDEDDFSMREYEEGCYDDD